MMRARHVTGILLLIVALLALGINIFQHSGTNAGREFIVPVTKSQGPAFFHSGLVEPDPQVPRVHAATAAPVSNGILAAWYGGSREGARDVKLYQARFTDNGWSRSEVILDRQQAMNQLGIYVRKIGNPLLHRASDGRHWLFFVTVSHGGWAGSQINYMISTDEGRHWSPARTLITSPFINISTLVKGAAVQLSGNVIGLPVYHEFLRKFSEFLRIGADGKVLHKSRISTLQGTIQPTLAVRSNHMARAWLRASGTPRKRIYQTTTLDAGISWGPLQATDLPNPDSAMATLELDGGAVLMAFNDAIENRENLRLAISADGGPWQRLRNLEDTSRATIPGGMEKTEYSYPFLLRDDSGNIHLLYTWHRTHIKHLVFNQAWLQQQQGMAP